MRKQEEIAEGAADEVNRGDDGKGNSKDEDSNDDSEGVVTIENKDEEKDEPQLTNELEDLSTRPGPPD